MSTTTVHEDRVEVRLRATATLPRALLAFTLLPRRSGAKAGLPMIAVAAVTLPDAGDVSEEMTAYDDGAVVVDRDDQGRIRAFEFNANRDIHDLPEYAAAIRSEKNEATRALLIAAHATAQLERVRLEGFIAALNDGGAKKARRFLQVFDKVIREVRERRAETSRAAWRTGAAMNPSRTAGAGRG